MGLFLGTQYKRTPPVLGLMKGSIPTEWENQLAICKLECGSVTLFRGVNWENRKKQCCFLLWVTALLYFMDLVSIVEILFRFLLSYENITLWACAACIMQPTHDTRRASPVLDFRNHLRLPTWFWSNDLGTVITIEMVHVTFWLPSILIYSIYITLAFLGYPILHLKIFIRIGICQ